MVLYFAWEIPQTGPNPSKVKRLTSPGTITLLAVLFLLSSGALLAFLGEPVFWPGFWAIAFFYGLIFYIGALAARRESGDSSESLFLAGRAVPLWMGAFTMSATWVGGGYINGTAESTAASGLAWVQAPWGSPGGRDPRFGAQFLAPGTWT